MKHPLCLYSELKDVCTSLCRLPKSEPLSDLFLVCCCTMEWF